MHCVHKIKNDIIPLSFISYINIAVIGGINDIAKGSSQTAFAHEFYELVRTLFLRKVKNFIHGELVAMGLAVQLEYNKQGEQILALCNLLKKYALPLYLFDIPIAPTKENMENLFPAMADSDSMANEGAQGHERLRSALNRLFNTEIQ